MQHLAQSEFPYRYWLVILCGLVLPWAALAQGDRLSALVDRSMVEAKLQMRLHEQTWGIHKATESRIDQETGMVSWDFENGRTVEAPAQIIGTYNRASNAFVWSWANHTILASMHEHASIVRAYGQTHGFNTFTTKAIRISEEQALGLTAVANRLAQASGIFRADAGGLVVFMTFGKVRVVK